MWIEGYRALINTDCLRSVYVREPNNPKFHEWATGKWELMGAFHSINSGYDEVIEVYDTEEEARSAQGLFLALLQGGTDTMTCKDLVEEMGLNGGT